MDELRAYTGYKGDRRVSQKKVYSRVNVFLAIISLLIIIVGIIESSLLFEFNMSQIFVMSFILGLFYIVLLFFLLRGKTVKTIKDTKYVRVPEVKEIIREIEKPVYIKPEVNKLNISAPHYDYVGSINTKVFHKKNCRLGKSIKQKFKLGNTSKIFFVRQGYKPCKLCKPNSKK